MKIILLSSKLMILLWTSQFAKIHNRKVVNTKRVLYITIPNSKNSYNQRILVVNNNNKEFVKCKMKNVMKLHNIETRYNIAYYSVHISNIAHLKLGLILQNSM